MSCALNYVLQGQLNLLGFRFCSQRTDDLVPTGRLRSTILVRGLVALASGVPESTRVEATSVEGAVTRARRE